MDISAYQHMNIRMSSRGKRPLRNLTPNDKVRAIQRIHNGETKASVSRDIGVPESTLRGWCKNEQKLRFMCRQLGPEHLDLDLGVFENRPEKRAKFDLRFSKGSNEEIGLGGFPFPAVDITHHKEAIREKLTIVELMKSNGFHPDALQEIRQSHVNNSGPVLTTSDYATNNVLQQFDFLAVLNSKHLSMMNDNILKSSPTNLNTISPPNSLYEAQAFNFPSLSVKNWAKDPVTNAMPNNIQLHANDKNNNDINLIRTTDISIPTGQNCMDVPQNSFLPAELSINLEDDSKITETDHKTTNQPCQAAAASMTESSSRSSSIGTHETNDSDESYSVRSAFFKTLSPLLHSDASNESYCDSEPEDLSVRSSASKLSSRSQSPDKSNSCSNVNSDSEH